MTAVEGDLPDSFPPDTDFLSASKRKFDQISDDNIVNGENTANDRHSPADVKSAIHSIWQILHAHDYPSAILSHVSSYQISSADDQKPSGKRQKLSPSPKPHTIASQLDQGNYDSLDAFASDVEAACADLLKSNQPKAFPLNGFYHWSLPPETLEQQHLIAYLSSFTKLLKSLVLRQKQSLGQNPSSAAGVSDPESPPVESKVNGVLEENGQSANVLAPPDTGRAVLTLFGNAQGHKQLFSSLQQPLSRSDRSDSFFESTADSVVPLRENGLPPGISSTRIAPTPRNDLSKSGQQKRLALKDVFASPASLPGIVPPKTPKLASSHDSIITWSPANAADQRTRQFGYTSDKLATGAWLGYDGIAPAEEPTTPQAKRKQRDRALSIGESSLISSQVTKAAQLQAEEEALFRSAYSSFAPSIDNSTAVISENMRKTLWWHKYGNRALDSGLDSDDDDEDGAGDDDQYDEDQLFKDAVDAFVPTTLAAEDTPESEEEVADKVLEDVSQMLEILNSYQRIRMSTLSSGPRSSLVQNSPLQDLTSDPATPSTAETETYQQLKAKLAAVVSQLPPHAVAKLKGDQLAGLNVSRDIPIEVEDYRGVMEEDKASRDAKQAAFQAAVGTAAASNRHLPIQPSNQHRPPQMPQSARHPPPHQHYNPNTPQSMPRGQPQFSRQPLSSWQKPNGNFQMSTQRPAYANPQHFNQQTPRNGPPPIRPGYNQMTPARPGPSPPLPNGVYQVPGQMNYQQTQRPQSFGSPNMNMPNGGHSPQANSPSKMMQQQPNRNYSPQTQQMPMQQQPIPHGSPTQYNQTQSPQQPQYRQPPQQMQQRLPQTPQQAAQLLQQNTALSNSPMARPSSSGGTGTLATTNANTETAVESRSGTPATTVNSSTPAPPQPTVQASDQPPTQPHLPENAATPQAQDVSAQQLLEQQHIDAKDQNEAEEPNLPSKHSETPDV